MAIDHSLALQVKSADPNYMLENGSRLAKFWLDGKTENELSRIYNESQGDLDKMLEVGQQSPMARWIMPQLQAQKTAQGQAQLETQKTLADIGNTRAQTAERYSNAGKNNADAGNTAQKTANSQYEAMQRAIGHAAATGDKNAAISAANAAKVSGAITPEQYSETIGLLNSMNSTEQIKQYAMSVQQMLSSDPAKYTSITADNALDNETSQANNIRSTKASMYSADVGAETADKNRLQNDAHFQKKMTIEQAKLKAQQEGGSIQVFGGNPYFIDRQGNARPISHDTQGRAITANGSGMTEQQSKDALFGARMLDAHKILTDLEGEGVSKTLVSRLPMIGDGYSQVMPSLLGGANSKQQQYAQAQRDFINAVLRKESGAVIADSEFENAQKQYFPQIGDSPEVIKQKARNRELATNMIVGGSGAQGMKQIERNTQGGQQAQNQAKLENILFGR